MQSKSILRSPPNSVRFSSQMATPARSLMSIRSPYPSAGLPEGQWLKNRAQDTHRAVRPLSVTSVDTPTPSRRSISSINRARKPAPLDLESRLVESSIIRAKKPAPLDLESPLNGDFWQSLSLEEAAKRDDEPMVTALQYPNSGIQYGYVLRSPGIPKPDETLDRIHNSFMSPGKNSSFGRIVRRDITAPSPNDPFAAFPSFTAVLGMGSPGGLWSSVVSAPR